MPNTKHGVGFGMIPLDALSKGTLSVFHNKMLAYNLQSPNMQISCFHYFWQKKRKTSWSLLKR